MLYKIVNNTWKLVWKAYKIVRFTNLLLLILVNLGIIQIKKLIRRDSSMTHRETFNENGIVKIDSFITVNEAAQLMGYYESNDKLTNKGFIKEGTSNYKYNEKYTVGMHTALTPQVSSFLQDPVVPTYSLYKAWGEKSNVEPHKLDEASEITVLLCIGSDWWDWEFKFKNLKGEEETHKLKQGQGIIYKGNEVEHWTNEYIGGGTVKLMHLNYVKLLGDNQKHYFDKIINRG